MKKLPFIFCLCLFATLCLNAQITNTFPDSGNAGIGTTNPTNKLVVQGDSSPNLELKNSNYSNGGFILNRTNYGHQWKWWAESNVMYFDFSTDETNYSNKFTIKSNGNVGISNANPQDKLQISNTFVFHDGGHKILSLLYSPGAVDLDDTKYASEIRYDPTSGSLHLGTSSTVTNAPTARFSITKDGNVGIGTTAPNAGLEIFKSNTNNHALILNSSGLGWGSGMLFKNTSGLTYGIYSGADNKWHFTNEGVGDRLVIDNAGYIGIGTSTPSSKLQVEGRTSVGKSGILNLDWTNEANWGGSANKWSGYIGFNAYRNNDEIKDSYYGNNQYTSKGVFEGSNYGFRWLFRKVVNNDSQSQHQLSEYMRLDNDGNLGIGTTPDAKLTVKGNIHTNEVKVDLLGAVAPDYVFYKDYDLKSLKAVEDYIASNGHLPNIPSAKDMETEGIMLKEMNLKLLEKIEELTLYTINQEKRIETLEKENTTLKTQEERIAQLEEKIKLLLNKK
ncbi:hypothetical protein CJ739_1729 [Mariniflexile rhizosphaerae]|uniref:bZIP transcription factor n=1 Tax=unclassified Mariniflexile TaxID=2643887 RepID=UPI000CB6A281|nr:bZIP transcription factor [Mariniflexile sp. TRM1-10]AXP80815.1 hypothetical protein CJ739_1729 [Mariniflexile sp. TRM1-10]PLB17655.1 MAG: hypothetical protein TRG1_3505 [Flavobacteriaceae bacterium FS1-H7996/R]